MREVWQIRMVSLRKETEQQNPQIIQPLIESVETDIFIYQLLFVTTGTDIHNNYKHAHNVSGSQFGERICVARQVLWHCDYQVRLFFY